MSLPLAFLELQVEVEARQAMRRRERSVSSESTAFHPRIGRRCLISLSRTKGLRADATAENRSPFRSFLEEVSKKTHFTSSSAYSTPLSHSCSRRSFADGRTLGSSVQQAFKNE